MYSLALQADRIPQNGGKRSPRKKHARVLATPRSICCLSFRYAKFRTAALRPADIRSSLIARRPRGRNPLQPSTAASDPATRQQVSPSGIMVQPTLWRERVIALSLVALTPQEDLKPKGEREPTGPLKRRGGQSGGSVSRPMNLISAECGLNAQSSSAAGTAPRQTPARPFRMTRGTCV